MDHLNSSILVGRYYSLTKIDESVSCLVIVIKENDGDISIPVIIGNDVADKILEYCKYDDVIGIKGKINADKDGIIIVANKVTFLQTKRVD